MKHLLFRLFFTTVSPCYCPLFAVAVLPKPLRVQAVQHHASTNLPGDAKRLTKIRGVTFFAQGRPLLRHQILSMPSVPASAASTPLAWQHAVHLPKQSSLPAYQLRLSTNFMLGNTANTRLVFVQEEQVEYLDDSEVDFSSDDDEEDMEDYEGGDEGRLPAGQSQLGKRPSGTVSCHASHASSSLAHCSFCCMSLGGLGHGGCICMILTLCTV